MNRATRPPAKLPSMFGAPEEQIMKKVGRPGQTLQIRPSMPEGTPDTSEYSSASMDAHFEKIDVDLSNLDKKINDLIEQAGREWQAATNFSCDANGNQAGVYIYEHKDGFMADICQVIFWLDGQTPASVFSTANAWCALYKNTVSPTSLVAYTPQAGSTTVFPLTVNIPNDVPPILRMNDKLVAVVGGSVGGLANKNVTVIVNGTMKRELV